MILSLSFESVLKMPTSCAVPGYFIFGLYDLFMVILYQFEVWYCYLINDKYHFKMCVAADQTLNVLTVHNSKRKA